MKASAIAIVGIAGRFPGARNLTQFWSNLRDGVESIRDCSDGDLIAAGASHEQLAEPTYVKRASILDDVPLFDAAFFGLSQRDASIMDPQHRHFLECAWEALEDAAHPPESFAGSIGVFAGSGMNTYLIHNLLANQRLVETAGLFQLKQTGNDKDVLATRVSYQFDLRGPSINVQTACSTSLVAVHLGCQSLLSYECDMALAGGVTIEIPHGLGYTYREGEILSRDGRCRAFDAVSSGTVFGSGVGIVVLRRLEDALESNDRIHAIILGSAINNDGARKVGYLAPSVEGQAEVIQEALDFAGVSASEISYVEAHGTGTVIGDPIEVRALTQAFRKSTTGCSYCGIGSLKSNVGHLDAAAGVAGLIKTVLSLKNAQMPPTLHFKNINQHIELKDSPFFINDKLRDWHSNGSPRRAGVTSLGIGGTNAHVVLEEAPRTSITRRPKPSELLVVSAKTKAAADQALKNLTTHVLSHPEQDLADVAFTCQVGRQPFPHRRALVVENHAETAAVLNPAKPDAIGVAFNPPPGVVFMFSGQGSQYVNMGRQLYEIEPVFRETLEMCAQHLKRKFDINLIEALYPPEHEKESAAEILNQTWLTQPALFSVEYALAHWWMSLGVKPSAMVGHSIGEYVAACLAGVFSFEDALEIVALRGRLIYDLPGGSMLAVPLAADEIPLDQALSLAAINSPRMCVVSGPTSATSSLDQNLKQKGIACRLLKTSHAFHSAMMEPILSDFEARLRDIVLRPPLIPYLSNVSGKWITPEEATNPAYWARHIRQTVRFSDDLAEVFRKPNQILIEVGPGNVLTSLANQQRDKSAQAFQSLPHPHESVSDLHCALKTLGQLWVAGVDIVWSKMRTIGSAQCVSLPTYPFEHKKFWIDPDRTQPNTKSAPSPEQAEQDEKAAGLYCRVWRPAPLTKVATSHTSCWMIFRDSLGLADAIASQLNPTAHEVILVDPGSIYKKSGKRHFTIRPEVREDYDSLFADVTQSGRFPEGFLHLWSVTAADSDSSLERTLEKSFYSPLYLAQALASGDITNANILLVSNRLQDLGNEVAFNPARAVLLGPARVIPKELAEISCRAVDVDAERGNVDVPAAQIIAEMESSRENAVVAYRGVDRFVEGFERFDVSNKPERRRLDRGATYLITGGLGALGMVVAERLALEFKARLILVSRAEFPRESEWEASLNDVRRTEDEKGTIRKLIEIRSLAGGLMVFSADVTNLEQMRSVVQEARRRYGKIDGVFHAAGILDDGPLVLKTAQRAARVLDPKVKGTLILEEVLRDDPLKCFVLFSSISSIFPPAGQVDYAAANAFLEAFALNRKGPVTAVDWDAWREIGMAARRNSPHPLLNERLLETPGQIVYASQFSPDRQWLLSEHRLKTGKALLPGTGYLEMAGAAFAANTFRTSFEIRDAFFLAPLSVEASESKELRVELTREVDAGPKTNAFGFSIWAQDGKWVEHASGHILPCLKPPGTRIDRSAVAARCNKREIVFDSLHRTRQERYFEFGPRWQCLNWLRVGDHEGLARLELDPTFNRDFASFRMHPSLLDMATGCSLYLIDNYESLDDLYLPFSYRSLCVFHALPPVFFSHIRSLKNQPRGEIQTFDITLFDEQGEPLAEITDFSMRRISDPARAGVPDHVARDDIRLTGRQPVEIVRHAGIPPTEGARILARILAATTPAVLIVSTEPLEVGANQITASSPRTVSTAETNHGVEATLARWLQDLLGVEEVGLDDDFFDLGGHSLIGVRLFAKIKKAYQVDLELAALFESRTVRLLADRVRKAQRPIVTISEKSSCLVPIQPDGSQIPLFLIHAVGGEVLFYEPLAKALGPDRPVYALQSNLTNREILDETSIEELATVYVNEIRSSFPDGPYLIGGLSYGGLVAYEMAQQLRVQGAEPALLVMIDTLVPGSKQHIEVSAQMATLLRYLREQGLTFLLRKAVAKYEYLSQKLIHQIRLIVSNRYTLANRPLPPALRYALMDEIHRRALESYRFQPYRGKICLIRAIERGYKGIVSLSELDDPALGWGSLALGGLEIYDVDADHSNILLKPQVTAVAEKVDAMFAQLDPRPVPAQPVA
jgi:acyl transferase domain-containing protein/thioesterase domain-containing protein